MTPEQRAAEALALARIDGDREDLVKRVAAAIREAIAVEREACARLAAVMGMPRDDPQRAGGFTPEQESEARLAMRIATAITSRGG